jgi:hypothetical protein
MNKVGIQADNGFLFQGNSIVMCGEDAAIESLATFEQSIPPTTSASNAAMEDEYEDDVVE